MKLDSRVQQGAALVAGLCVLFAATVGVTKFLHRRPVGPAPATPEQIVAQAVATNPALVSRDACIRLAVVPLPSSLLDPNRTPIPTQVDAEKQPDENLRSWLSRFNPPLANLPMNHEQLVMSVMATMPTVQARRDAAHTRIQGELRQIDVYKEICAKTWPAKDRLAASLVTLHRTVLMAIHPMPH
ncbi:TPA: hypothetical protein QDB43_000341 [Burkholderia vietnamiensis]|uniref:hypothetical protein n=1 Tax=Burkholderia pseudomallei TaxID=28450 RepID=UPI0021F7ABA1|nr:hypothetical protein [Burkholderia pseudomallei]MCW0166345.1 hypothetical protein [Burkholderia pseudomallei]HDR9236656.1 hypothetical protein [Burkholderia vietnamiensis]